MSLASLGCAAVALERASLGFPGDSDAYTLQQGLVSWWGICSGTEGRDGMKFGRKGQGPCEAWQSEVTEVEEESGEWALS